MDPAALFRLDGKVAVITGSTRGIGRATAEMMARLGASAVISSRKSEACDAVAAEFATAGLTALALPCHVAEAEGRARLIGGTLEAFGRIDILVTNAGINPTTTPLAQLSEESWDKVFAVNLKAAWQLSQLALPEIARQGGGAMVLLSSIASLTASPGSGPYAVAKAGVNHLARQLAEEWGPSGIRVNSVAPGVTLTDMIRAKVGTPEAQARAAARTALRRIGAPEDVAATILFLCSDAGRQITGQTIVVDGGATLTAGLRS
ncbi:glucose 1-dehydrogenase [Frigidibacter albus]|uniref:Glucose 1-dehydrogenase n=1 Tax=Frigidibacter albus TaxID=1465486 RepID=A0A6L8VMP2_9RHOB|nr:SDR family oxidoreductase [Frigidibacter albus]MZQ91066.1 glucose 1-dehydrogenase [Frigidibacter albus]NBE32951.1 glucose 1-dehydrogenase [Frigidibacter albus]GGH62613.1 dehydrogenase [Frigidibacter albus]